MKQQTRELLVTTRVAQHWQDDFDQRVDELMSIVSKIDNEQKMQDASETMDVYHNATHKAHKAGRKKKLLQNDRPFEFLVFRN